MSQLLLGSFSALPAPSCPNAVAAGKKKQGTQAERTASLLGLSPRLQDPILFQNPFKGFLEVFVLDGLQGPSNHSLVFFGWWRHGGRRSRRLVAAPCPGALLESDVGDLWSPRLQAAVDLVEENPLEGGQLVHPNRRINQDVQCGVDYFLAFGVTRNRGVDYLGPQMDNAMT